MAQSAFAVGFALFVWWFSTGAILALVRLKHSTHAFGMMAATVFAALALIGLVATRSNTTIAGAYAGFTYGIIVWAWLEMSFLYGYVTGPRRVPLDQTTRGWSRFRAAFDTVSFHEIAILCAGLVMVACTWNAANQVGAQVFLVLWAMRISAKLNLFFGAPNISTEMLPTHLDYLGSYFAKRRTGLFFPVSVTLASLVFGIVVHAATTAADPFTAVSLTLIATLLGLAIIEHWFLVLPIRDAALWKWALQAVDVGRISSDVGAVVPVTAPARASRDTFDAGQRALRQPALPPSERLTTETKKDA